MTASEDWTKVGELQSSEFAVDVMITVYPGKEEDAQSIEKQQVEWFAVNELPNNIMSNLSWLIPLCIDKLANNEIDTFVTTHAF